jgi:hypothetical protein
LVAAVQAQFPNFSDNAAELDSDSELKKFLNEPRPGDSVELVVQVLPGESVDGLL